LSACSALRRRLFAAPTLDRMLAKDRQTIGPAGIALSRAALIGIAAVFFLMGAQGAAYGPLLLPLTHRFGIDLPTAGASISANFAGGLIAVTAGLGLLSRVAARPFVWGALGLTALGALAVALAPAWPLVLGGVAVAGTGLGALDIGLTNIVAHSRGTRNSARLNLVNGAYGLGAVTGPLLVTLAGGDLLPLFGGGALVALALVPAVAGIRGRLPHEPEAGRPGRGLLVLLFMAAFVLYVGVEWGIGGWMPSHLVYLGHPAATAAVLTSGFWLLFAVGRLLAALIPAGVSEGAIVLGGCAAATLALLLAAAGPLAPAGYLLAGLAIAPIWPTAVGWLARRRPRDTRATAWLFPAAAVGGAVIPGGIGFLLGWVGLGWTPLVLAAVAAGTLVAFGLAARSRG